VSAFLLDVNVLIALIDEKHEKYHIALDWFSEASQSVWLTTPITENGAIRIVTQPRYRIPAIRYLDAVLALHTLTNIGQHRFCADNLSLLDPSVFDHLVSLNPKNITDTYLLALAAHHDAALATFDRRIVTDAVRLPNARIHLIGQET